MSFGSAHWLVHFVVGRIVDEPAIPDLVEGNDGSTQRKSPVQEHDMAAREEQRQVNAAAADGDNRIDGEDSLVCPNDVKQSNTALPPQVHC